MSTRTIRVCVDDESALNISKKLRARWDFPATACVEILVADRLRLAQALRLLRDTTSEGGYVQNVCVRALADCGIEDPPEEDHL